MTDLYTRDARVATLLKTARRGDWPATRAFFANLTDTEDVTFFARLLADVKNTETWLTKAAEAEPDSTLPRLLLGYRYVSWAWKARGRARANFVPRRAWPVFFDRLRHAEELLSGILRDDPDNVAAWAQSLVTSRGLQLGIQETLRRFEELVARRPHHYFAHSQMLQQLCEKWGGSHETMFAFARSATAAAPIASPLGALVAEAHVERWVNTAGLIGYFRGKSVMAEIREAAQRSTAHIDYRFELHDVQAPNMFAFAFAAGGQRDDLRTQLRLLKGQSTFHPWAYTPLGGDGRLAFNLRRLRAHLRP